MLSTALGITNNFHPTKEEIIASEAEERERRRIQAAAIKADEELKLKEEQDIRHRLDQFKEVKGRQLKAKMEEMLEAGSKPLREYLDKNVMPLLNRGIDATLKAEPDDPIDFLAEWLFTNNRKK